MSWTEERIKTLKKMWKDGKTASEIAEELGDVTRNAVIGKAHRLGLSGRPSPLGNKGNKGSKASKSSTNSKAKKKTTAKKAPAKKAAASSTSKKTTKAKAAPKKAEPSPKKDTKPAPKAKDTKKPVAKTAPEEKTVTPAQPVPIEPKDTSDVLASARQAPSLPPERPFTGKKIGILELTERKCRWPIGDPQDEEFGYCGAETIGGYSYCAEHLDIAYQARVKKSDAQATGPRVKKHTTSDTAKDDQTDGEVEDDLDDVEDFDLDDIDPDSVDDIDEDAIDDDDELM